MATTTDDRLTKLAAQGDRQAFEAIYERYHRDLYRFCLAMIGNPQDAQDTLQNTMIKVLRALPGETRHIQLKPWLYRIARNEAVETMRRRRDSVEIEPEHTVSVQEVADTVEARERLRRLLTDLEQLPERQRAALVMRELADLGFEQIGEAFETSAATARQTVYEARLSLRQMEEGREMSCDLVMRELSDADGRVTRRREVRAHLRSCPSCRAFADSMATRRSQFAMIAPLPLALSTAIMHGILSGKASAATVAGGGAGAGAGGTGAGSGIAGTIGAGAGKAVATSAILKSVATVAVVAAVGVGAADRSGLIHVPLLSGSHSTSQQGSPQSPAAGGATGGATTQQGQKRAAGAKKGAGRHAGSAAAKRRGAGGTGSHRHAGAGGNGARSQGASHAARGGANAHSHGRSHAGSGSKGTAASGHGKEAAEAHKPAPHNPAPAPSHSGNGASHGHSSPPRRPAAKPRPPKVAPPVPSPPAGEAGGSGASSSAQRPAAS